MSIPRIDFFNFLFNSGRGIKGSQVTIDDSTIDTDSQERLRIKQYGVDDDQIAHVSEDFRDELDFGNIAGANQYSAHVPFDFSTLEDNQRYRPRFTGPGVISHDHVLRHTGADLKSLVPSGTLTTGNRIEQVNAGNNRIVLMRAATGSLAVYSYDGPVNGITVQFEEVEPPDFIRDFVNEQIAAQPAGTGITDAQIARLLPSPTALHAGQVVIQRVVNNVAGWVLERLARVATSGEYDDIANRPHPSGISAAAERFLEHISLLHTTEDVNTPWTATAPFNIAKAFSSHQDEVQAANDITRSNRIVGSGITIRNGQNAEITGADAGDFRLMIGMRMHQASTPINGPNTLYPLPLMRIYTPAPTDLFLVYYDNAAGRTRFFYRAADNTRTPIPWSGNEPVIAQGTEFYVMIQLRPSGANVQARFVVRIGNANYTASIDNLGTQTALSHFDRVRCGSNLTEFPTQTSVALRTRHIDGCFLPAATTEAEYPSLATMGNYGATGLGATPGVLWGQVTAGTSTTENHTHIKIAEDLEVDDLVGADGLRNFAKFKVVLDWNPASISVATARANGVQSVQLPEDYDEYKFVMISGVEDHAANPQFLSRSYPVALLQAVPLLEQSDTSKGQIRWGGNDHLNWRRDTVPEDTDTGAAEIPGRTFTTQGDADRICFAALYG